MFKQQNREDSPHLQSDPRLATDDMTYSPPVARWVQAEGGILSAFSKVSGGPSGSTSVATRALGGILDLALKLFSTRIGRLPGPCPHSRCGEADEGEGNAGSTWGNGERTFWS